MLQNTQSIEEAVKKIKWFHCIDLGNGVITPGMDESQRRLRMLKMPEDLRGKTVLDVGSWNGFFAFEAERRGAARVLATDSFCWSGEGWGTKEGFELARQILSSKVEDYEIDVLDLSPEAVGVFDVVLFLGVLYHMRHPLLALERVASVTKEMLILDTELDLMLQQRPAMAFYPERELSNDPTNWFGPNAAAVVAMLKTVGFQRVEIITPLLHPVRRLSRGIKGWLRNREPFLQKIQRDRVIFHAWK